MHSGLILLGMTGVDDSPWARDRPLGRGSNRYRWGGWPGRWLEPRYAPALSSSRGGGEGARREHRVVPAGSSRSLVPSITLVAKCEQRQRRKHTVNNTTIPTFTNTTVINNRTTNITNVKLRQPEVRNAVTAVPQQAHKAQPVRRAAVRECQAIESATVSARSPSHPRSRVLGAARY